MILKHHGVALYWRTAMNVGVTLDEFDLRLRLSLPGDLSALAEIAWDVCRPLVRKRWHCLAWRKGYFHGDDHRNEQVSD